MVNRKRGKQFQARGRSRWQNMPRDIMSLIFSRLDSEFLCLTVSTVCSSWRSACWDVLFWRPGEHLLCFPKLKCDSFLGDRLFEDARTNHKSLSPIQSLMVDRGSDGRFKINSTLSLSLYNNISDSHLIYIANRSPKLQRLILPNAARTSGKAFSRAIRKWREIEEIQIGCVLVWNLEHIIQEIGINCKKLRELCLSGFHSDTENLTILLYNCLSGYTATVIHDRLPRLKQLSLKEICVDKPGLLTLLSKSKELQTVHIMDCSLEAKQPIQHASITIHKAGGKGKGNKWHFVPQEGTYSTREAVDFIWDKFRI